MSLAILVLLVAALLSVRRKDYVLASERVRAGGGLGSKRARTVPLTDEGALAFALVEDPPRLHQRALQVVDVA